MAIKWYPADYTPIEGHPILMKIAILRNNILDTGLESLFFMLNNDLAKEWFNE